MYHPYTRILSKEGVLVQKDKQLLLLHPNEEGTSRYVAKLPCPTSCVNHVHQFGQRATLKNLLTAIKKHIYSKLERRNNH